MAAKVKYPIRLKLLLAMSGLVLLVTVIYLALAFRLFGDDKRSLVMELNASGVKTVAADVQSTLSRYVDRVRLLTQGRADPAWLQALLKSDPELVAYELHRLAPETNEWRPLARHLNEGALRELGLGASGLGPVRTAVPVPFAEATARGAVARNSTLPGVAPLLTLAVAVEIRDDAAPHVAVLDLRMDRLLRSVAREGLATRFVTDEEGRVLAHPDRRTVEERVSLAALPLVREAVDSPVALQLNTYDAGGERWLGAHAKAGVAGVIVFSQVNESEAFLPVRRLVEKSLLFGSIVVTLAILLSRGLARSFTRPLEGSCEVLERKVRERTAALEEALVQNARLAAHEILNPLNNINLRFEKLRAHAGSELRKDLQLADEILNGWEKAWRDGGWDRLREELAKSAGDERPLLEEDLENLRGIHEDARARLEAESEAVDFLLREVARISRIVNNMRSLSRVGSERRPIDVHLPIDDTTVALGDVLELQAVELIKDYASEPRERFAVKADRDELVQVFSNLIRNAAQAIGTAGRRAGKIHVRTRRAGDRVEVRVEDNGAGIAEADRARIFEPDFTTKSLEQGTGLGLSISRRLVRALGGELELERTQEGESTVILVRLPAHDAERRDDGAAKTHG
jgi:signal transduction histidine kinase